MNRHFLFFFIDGVGLGPNNPDINPFTRANLPFFDRFLEGKKLILESAPTDGKLFSLRAMDAGMGVNGIPQSATGQAVLLTGKNIPAEIGYHYGPKPNEEIAAILRKDNLFSQLVKAEKKACLLNAYPQRFFDSIESGRRLLSAIPLSVVSSGLNLFSTDDLYQGDAMAADFTGKGWREHLGLVDTPLLSPFEAGERIYQLSMSYDFTFFEYWLTDYVGHAQDMPAAERLLEELDQVLCGLISEWDWENGLILVISDHGNMEDLSTHRHTQNPIPALVIGAPELRLDFIHQISSLADIAPTILRFLGNSTELTQ